MFFKFSSILTDAWRMAITAIQICNKSQERRVNAVHWTRLFVSLSQSRVYVVTRIIGLIKLIQFHDKTICNRSIRLSFIKCKIDGKRIFCNVILSLWLYFDICKWNMNRYYIFISFHIKITLIAWLS